MWRVPIVAIISLADEHGYEKWLPFFEELSKNPVAKVEFAAVVAPDYLSLTIDHSPTTYNLLLATYYPLATHYPPSTISYQLPIAVAAATTAATDMCLSHRWRSNATCSTWTCGSIT